METMERHSIYDLTFAPEHQTFDKEAVVDCLEKGAAKLAGVVTPETVERLAQRVSQDKDIFLRNAPELQSVFDYLIAITGVQPVIRVEYHEPQESPFLVSHHDSNAREGLSLLIPLWESPALFVAGEANFALSPTSGLPSFMSHYKSGDVMLLRQYIKSIDGETVGYGQTPHCGAGLEGRRLVTVDFISPDLVFGQ